MIKLATPVSHLFHNEENEKLIIDHSDVLECRDKTIQYNNFLTKQELFHCDLQPIHEWGDNEWSFIKRIKDTKTSLKLLTFHLATCCDKPKIEGRVFKVGGREYSKKEMKTYARQNLTMVKKFFRDKIDIGIENNNYYPTEAYKFITEPDFISDIVYENDLSFLFDIAHAKITCFNKNVNFEKYKNELPLKKAIQIHICKYSIDKSLNQAYDAHNSPAILDLLEVGDIISKHPCIKYLTVEYYRDVEKLRMSLDKVRELI